MESILIPTDFSPAAYNAVRYAVMLFQGRACTFQLLNTYTPDFINSRVMAMSHHALNDEDPIEMQSESELRNLVNELEAAYPNSGISFETYSSFSLLSEEIRDRTESGRIDLIVSGTHGTAGGQYLFLGSNTVRIIKSADSCPVLVVPAEALPKTPSHIGLATDFNSTYSKMQLEYLHFFASRFPLRLDILYVGLEQELSAVQLQHKKELTNDLIDLNPVIQWIQKDDSKALALQNAISKYKIDLLVLVRNRHNLFNTLLREPVVKRMAFYTTTPLLVLPETAE